MEQKDIPTVDDLIELAEYDQEETPVPPFVPTTLVEDMPVIRSFSAKYSDLRDDIIQTVDKKLIHDGKSLDYYHGAFVTLYQILSMTAEEEHYGEVTSFTYAMICSLCRRIVGMVDNE